MPRFLFVAPLGLVSVVVGGVLLVLGAFAQQRELQRLDFVLAAQLAGPTGHDLLVRRWGDPPVEVRAADYNPGFARRTLVPLMQRFVGVGDMDGDGTPDLYVIRPNQPNLLLQGTLDGRFRDITDSARAAGPAGSLSAAFSDYDHSGRQSLFVCGTEGITVFRNNGKNSFSEATREAGLQSIPGVLWTHAALGDLDGDGFPDLLLAAYTDLNRPPSKTVFTFPNDFAGAVSRLYRNNRNGTFTDVTESVGLGKNPGRARKAILADFDADERLDILLLRDDKPPVLYLNRGGWKFDDVTWDAGDDLTTHAFFEAAVADFNRDGKTDLALWSTHSFRILINQGHATFERVSSTAMPEPAIRLFDFRGVVADLDDNGLDDVITVDPDGRLRAFTNHSGAFREASLALPEGFEAGYFTGFRSRGTNLLTIQPNGRISLLAQVRRAP